MSKKSKKQTKPKNYNKNQTDLHCDTWQTNGLVL